jgi:hypothetical protein
MKKVFVLLSFIRLRIALKIEFYKTVIQMMTGNKSFTTPDVPMTELSAALAVFEKNFMDAQNGSHEAVIKQSQSEQTMDDLMRKTASYVDRIADGDAAVIASAGFESSKQPDSAMRPIFSVEAGDNPGEVVLRCKAVAGAHSYNWQFALTSIPEKDEGWTYAGSSTKTSFTITDLTSMSKYWFRFCAVKPDGMTPWSAPITKVVQ